MPNWHTSCFTTYKMESYCLKCKKNTRNKDSKISIMCRYFKVFSITQYLEYVSEWKSKGLSNESIKAISTSDNSLNPTLSYYDTKIRVKFTGGCLKQPKVSYTLRKVVNIYIVYALGASSSNDSDPTLKNC